jgi:hypothetical protein
MRNCGECGNEHTGSCPPLEDGDYSETWRESWSRYPNAMANNMGH